MMKLLSCGFKSKLEYIDEKVKIINMSNLPYVLKS